MIYDYSNLLKAIDNAQLEEKKLNNQILANKKDELAELEMEIEQSGMLEDWYQLIEAMKKLGVRGFPYTEYKEPTIEGNAIKFTDGYRFMETMSSGSHWCDCFGIDGYNVGNRRGWSRNKVNWVITHSTSSHLWEDFETWGGDVEAKRVRTKIRLLKEFKESYPIYREFKLKEIYAALGKQIETNESLRKEI